MQDDQEDIDPGGMDLESLLDQKERLDSLIRDKYTKTVTVMFTDLKGSTSMAEDHGDISTRMLIKDHNNIVFPLIKNNNGVLVKSMGDGTLSYFDKAQDALRAGVCIQREFTEYNKRKRFETLVQIRVGMHTGNVIIEESDIYGDVVNTASRFESSAEPGQVQLSEFTYDALSDKDEIPCRFIKETILKGKKDPFKVYRAYCDPEELKADLEAEMEHGTLAMPTPAATAAPAAMPPGTGTQAPLTDDPVLRQAYVLRDSNELVQLYLYCQEHAASGAVQEVRQALEAQLGQAGPRPVSFYGEEALWFFKPAITVGRLKEADLPLTNRAISRAAVNIGISEGQGVVMGEQGIKLLELDAGGTKVSLAPDREYPMGTNGKLIFSACFPMDYRVHKERFLVLKMHVLEDCVKQQVGLPLVEVWKNFQYEFGKLVIIGT